MQTFSYKNWENMTIALAGSYQIKNAALALEGVEALRKLGFQITDHQVRDGLLRTAWRGPQPRRRPGAEAVPGTVFRREEALFHHGHVQGQGL